MAGPAESPSVGDEQPSRRWNSWGRAGATLQAGDRPRGGVHEQWRAGGEYREPELILMTLFLLSFLFAAMWAIPRLLSRSAVRVPSRVPEQWVAEYRSEDQ